MGFNVDDDNLYLRQNKYNSEYLHKNTDLKDKFLFSNGKVIDLKNIKSDIKIDYNVFKRYDGDKNSVFNNNEISAICEDLASGELSEAEEVSLYASITGLSIEKANTELYTNTSADGEGVFKQEEKSPQQIVISRILNSTSNAMEIFNKSLTDAGV